MKEEERTNPSAQEARDGLELQEVRETCLEGGEGERAVGEPGRRTMQPPAASETQGGERMPTVPRAGVGHEPRQSRDLEAKKNASRTQGQRC